MPLHPGRGGELLLRLRAGSDLAASLSVAEDALACGGAVTVVVESAGHSPFSLVEALCRLELSARRLPGKLQPEVLALLRLVGLDGAVRAPGAYPGRRPARGPVGPRDAQG